MSVTSWALVAPTYSRPVFRQSSSIWATVIGSSTTLTPSRLRVLNQPQKLQIDFMSDWRFMLYR